MKVITNSRIEVERRIGAQSELGIMYVLTRTGYNFIEYELIN